MTTYTYICKNCEKPCQISIHTDSDTVMGRRCKDRSWTPISKCFEPKETTTWELFSIVPDVIGVI